ncbi:hypothetical protein [Mucilaginibacter ginsenosidivorax]|uniref:DUF4890 domain-containing protein n=1 Tax=Mucilaginibacter ginsenosidivorax TaxID=862126 RepID=A0A5B8W7N6_9SPHI|nr:hypothetical protein [Mucilaginibacter ginsenosidivorax]QEC79619.1 hypothetical protein FSB76_28050 [Mucilaginibacter ginsenosidivorax]
MKKVLMMIAFIAGLGLFARAQEKAKATPALRAAKQTKVLAKQLNLTNSQITQVNAVLLEQGKGLDSLKALKGTNDKKEQHYAHKLIRDNAQSKLEAILTPDQKTKYTAFVDAQRERKMARKKIEPAPAPKN